MGQRNWRIGIQLFQYLNNKTAFFFPCHFQKIKRKYLILAKYNSTMVEIYTDLRCPRKPGRDGWRGAF